MKTITIFETSDTHGYLYPSLYHKRQENRNLGLLKLASLLKEERDGAQGASLTIENGDFIQGSPLSFYVQSQLNDGTALAEVFNLLSYDGGVIGNHEFNYGLSYLKSVLNHLNYPILNANIINHKGQLAFGQPYHIYEREGVKIGVLGLTTQYIPHWEHPKNYEGLDFLSAIAAAKRYVPELREIVDILIVSYHGGFEKNVWSGEETEEQTGENEGYRILKEVEGIDVLLAGHQHKEYATLIDDVAVVMPGDKAATLAKVELDVEQKNGGFEIVAKRPALVSVDQSTSVDVELEKYFRNLNETVENWLDQALGHVAEDKNMLIDDGHQARLEEHPYIELIQRVQLFFGGADISATALFNDNILGFDSVIRMRDIVTNYVYPNTLSVLKVSGADLKAAIEQSARYFSLDAKGEIVVSQEFMEPKPQVYNYDMYEGVEYIIDVAQPIGERVIKLMYKGQKVQPNQYFELVTNQYRGVGGGNFKMFNAKKVVREVNIPMTELIASYLQRHKEISSTVNHNFKVINSQKSKALEQTNNPFYL